MMEISQGSVVRLRRARWRVVDVRAFERCRLVTLAGLGPLNRGRQQKVLTPFDLLEPVERRSTLVRASPRSWRKVCRALIAVDTPPGGLRCAGRARIDLLPHQLEPALAMLRGLGSRALLADEVGLGKTIQAALIVAELRAAGVASRVLVVTPAGLRDQWRRELSDRLDLSAVVVDTLAVRRATATLPMGLSPWQTVPIAITSVDYIKRAEVLAAASACRWDVVIVDEAHGVASDSDRHAAVGALAARAPYVVLLTATPHNGDSQSFASLCALGATTGEELLVFRRTRQDVRQDSLRRVHQLRIRSSAAERLMHARLAAFTQAVYRNAEIRRPAGPGRSARELWLAISVLRKRAWSSAHSLQHSVARRLAALDGPPHDGASQVSLPFDDPSGETTQADDVPEWPAALGLRNQGRERQLLGALLDAATKAARSEAKINALNRLLARVREPAIIFTEYRDTLLHLERSLRRRSLVLHGGLAREERLSAIERFTTGAGDLLLATDAAGEGLNLHHTCRLVLNLELPWNPTRLEQRIGRVDRIGQRRTVHVFHLIAADAGESTVLSRLESRVARARADIGGPDPLGSGDRDDVENDMDRGMVATATTAQGAVATPWQQTVRYVVPSLSADAAEEAARIVGRRRFATAEDDEVLAQVESRGPLLMTSGRWRTRAALGRRILTVWRVTAEDGTGRTIASHLVTVCIAATGELPRTRSRIDDVLRARQDDVRRSIENTSRAWRERVTILHARFLATCENRERIVATLPRRSAAGSHQPGLFDRRAEHARLAILAAERTDQHTSAERLALLDRTKRVSFLPPELLLVLAP